MVSVKIILDTRLKKKDGTFPLSLRVIHNRKFFQLPLGYSIPEKDWDEKGQKIKGSCKLIENISRLNAMLNKERQKALEMVTKLQDNNQLETLSRTELKEYLAGKEAELNILTYTKEVIDQLTEAQKIGNAKVYTTLYRSIKTYIGGKDLPMKQITYTWLKKYETWYFSKGNSQNGLSVNMRTLRALFNRATKEKKLSKEYYPFGDYAIKSEQTRKRAISAAEIELIKCYEPKTERQRRAKDYFMISFYLMGASFVDLAYLKVKDIIGGRIEYKRRKTGRLHSIPISPPLHKFLSPYIDGKGKNDFILNVIKSEDPKQQDINVRDEIRRYNRSLKEIAKECGIEAIVTSYVSRHSYATIAKYKGVPTAVISEALGHSSEEVTQIYLSSFDKAVMDKYHAMIIDEA